MRNTAAAALAGAVGGAAVRAHPGEPASQAPAGGEIRIATIGAGGQGMGNTETALGVPGVRLVGVADCYDGRLARSRERWGPDLVTTRDYQELLARPDVDAVIIATPDHWHARIARDAMRAGKDVYVEKPMVQDLDEGPALIEAARESGRILQVGSQRVSSLLYKKAAELYRSGAIGALNMVEAWWYRGSAIGAWQYTIPPDASAATVDWERFQGNTPNRSFDPLRFFRWRNYRDYGTGVAGDLFVHLFSGTHAVVGSNGPVRVFATGGLRYWKDGRDVPDVMVGLYDYPATRSHPEFTVRLTVDFADASGESSGFRFIGPEGVITIGWNSVTLTRRPQPRDPGYTIDTFSEAVQHAYLEEHRRKYGEPEARESTDQTFFAPPGYSDLRDHFVTFFEAVRTRTPVVEDAVFGYRAAAPALLSNISYEKRRPLDWDPEGMRLR